MVTLTIDNKTIKAEKGMTVLEAAQSAGIEIPTLCAHDALKPYAACRLCIVEVEKNNRTTIESSCTYPADEGLTVTTNSPLVREGRRFIIELLLARCPNVKKIQDLAGEYKVDDIPLEWKKGNDYCILCGLCVRACDEVVQAAAIQFAGQGTDRVVDSPFHEKSSDCIGCGSCAFVCPSGIIKKHDIEQSSLCSPEGCEEQGPVREISNWQVEHRMHTCRECGNPYAPVTLLDNIAREHSYQMTFFDLCPSCRSTPVVDKEMCTACNSCIVVCPVGASQFVENGEGQTSYIFPENCCGCQTCVGVCGWGAVKVNDKGTLDQKQ